MHNPKLQMFEKANVKLIQNFNAKIQSNWLHDCVRFFAEENFDEITYFKNIEEQFLLANLSDTSEPVLPETFSFKTDSWTFQNTITLQMQSLVDISESFYEQLRHLHNILLDEVQEKYEQKTFQGKKKRTLKLELTDGYKTVSAMEYKPIPCLNTKLPPGVKIKITGPIQIVNRVIFLRPENVKILGGEVEELLVVNAYENILLKLLNKPTTENPIKNYKEEAVVEEKIVTRPNIIIKPMHQTSQFAVNRLDDFDNKQETEKKEKSITEMLMDDEDDIFAEIDIPDDINHVERTTVEQRWEMDEIENIEAMIAETITDEIESQPIDKIPKISKTPNFMMIPKILNTNANNIESDDEEIFSTDNKTTKKLSNQQTPHQFAQVINLQSPQKPVKKTTITDDDYAYKIEDSYNFVIIDQYLNLSNCEKMKRTYAIEAKTVEVLKLKIEGNKWLLRVVLGDLYSHNTLQARFDDEIVSKFAGRTATEINILREKIKIQPQYKSDIEASLTAIDNALQQVTMLMTITMNMNTLTDYENVVTKIMEKNDEAKNVMILKIEDENITFV